MRFLIGFLLLFSSLITTGQVRYVPIFMNQCTSDLSHWPYWYVTDSLGNHYDPNISNEEVTLPEIGQYYLHNDLSSSILLDSIPILVQQLSNITNVLALKQVYFCPYFYLKSSS